MKISCHSKIPEADLPDSPAADNVAPDGDEDRAMHGAMSNSMTQPLLPSAGSNSRSAPSSSFLSSLSSSAQPHRQRRRVLVTICAAVALLLLSLSAVWFGLTLVWEILTCKVDWYWQSTVNQFIYMSPVWGGCGFMGVYVAVTALLSHTTGLGGGQYRDEAINACKPPIKSQPATLRCFLP